MPGGRPVPAKALATPKLFENERLLLLEEGHCLRDQALSFCSLKQVRNLDTFGTTSLSTLVQMVANGFGVTLLPRMSLETEAQRGDIQLLAFAPPEPCAQDRAGVAEIVAAPPRFHRAWRNNLGPSALNSPNLTCRGN